MSMKGLLGKKSTLARKLRWRVLALSSIALLTLLGGMWVAWRSTLHAAAMRLDVLAAEVALTGDVFLGELQGHVDALAASVPRVEDVGQLFKLALDRQPAYRQLTFVHPRGTILAARQQGGHIPDAYYVFVQPWLDYARDGQSYIGPITYTEQGIPVVSMAVPVLDDARVLAGTLVAEIDLSLMADMLATLHLSESGSAYLTDASARVMLHLDIAQLDQTVPLIASEAMTVQQAVAGELITYQRDERGFLLTALALRTAPWYVWVEQPLAEIMLPFWPWFVVVLVVVLIAAVLLFTGLDFVNQQLLMPLQTVRQAASALAGGDFSPSLDIGTSGELRALATAMREIALRFQETMGEFERRVEAQRHAVLAMAEIARAAMVLHDVDTLTYQITALLREQLAFSYVGLFMLDESGDYALLRAEAGEGVQRSVEQARRYTLDATTTFGRCVVSGRAQIAPQLDVSDGDGTLDDDVKASSFEAQSEMLLPLRAQQHVMGVLQVQSELADAFDKATAQRLQPVADQVAAAIEQVRQYQREQAALREMERVQQRYLGEAWSQFIQQRPIRGYLKSQNSLLPLTEELLPGVEAVLENKTPQVVQEGADDTEPAGVVAPIVFRDRPLGAVGFDVAGHRWSEEQLAFVQAIAEQYGQAAENLRLVDATQRLASRERMVGEISAHIRETLELETVLMRAAEQIREALQTPEVTVRVAALPEDQGT